MEWVSYLAIVAAFGAIPGFIVGRSRRGVLAVAVLIGAAFAAFTAHLGVWAFSCWNCGDVAGTHGIVFNRRSDEFWDGLAFLSLLGVIALGGLLVGVFLRRDVNSQVKAG